MRARKVNCFLVGEAFMRAPEPGVELERLFGNRRMINIDNLIVGFDKGLRTLFAPAQTLRAVPGDDASRTRRSPMRNGAQAASLMRVNHSGEICAQALYQGQALTARDASARSRRWNRRRRKKPNIWRGPNGVSPSWAAAKVC